MQKLIQRQYNKIVLYVSAIINLKFQKLILTNMTTEVIRHLRELIAYILNLTFGIKIGFGLLLHTAHRCTSTSNKTRALPTVLIRYS